MTRIGRFPACAVHIGEAGAPMGQKIVNIFNMRVNSGEEFYKIIIEISQNNRLTEREQLVIMRHLDFLVEITGSVLQYTSRA